jgi:hypothetical protein
VDLRPADLRGEVAVHVLHETGEPQRVVDLEQGVPVVRQEDDAATPHRVKPLGAAEHAEDDLVDGRTGPQEQPGLSRPDRHLHQSPPFGHEAQTTWHLKKTRNGKRLEMSFLRMLN